MANPFDLTSECPDCSHKTWKHYRGRDYVGCHEPVYMPKVRSIFERQRRRGLVPCPCRRCDFDDLPPPPPQSEQGNLF